MKTTIFTIVFVAVIMCTGCTAQANSSTVTNEPVNVTYVNLPKSLIQIGMQMADDEDADKFLKQVDGIQILSFEEAPQKTKDKLFNHINNLETLGYEPMVKANEDGEKVRILLKGDEKVIHTLLIFAIDKEDCSLIKIDGHINPADVNDIVDTQIN